jgi:hypothetical protein
MLRIRLQLWRLDGIANFSKITIQFKDSNKKSPDASPGR